MLPDKIEAGLVHFLVHLCRGLSPNSLLPVVSLRRKRLAAISWLHLRPGHCVGPGRPICRLCPRSCPCPGLCPLLSAPCPLFARVLVLHLNSHHSHRWKAVDADTPVDRRIPETLHTCSHEPQCFVPAWCSFSMASIFTLLFATAKTVWISAGF